MKQAPASTGKTIIKVINPATEEQIGEIEDGGAAAVDAAVANARDSFDQAVWRGIKAGERGRILWKVADLLEQRSAEFATIEAANIGVSVGMAQLLVLRGASLFRYYAGWCDKISGRSVDLTKIGGMLGGSLDIHAYTMKEPIGVVGAIVPWNGPFYNATVKLAPALAAGCSVVLKPAEETPLTTLLLAKLLVEAGLPEGVVNIVNGYGHTTGAAISTHPGVDKVAFTGSTEVGKLIVQAAAGNLKKVALELGGKSPALIFDDADLSKAVPVATRSIFTPNAGQGCVCGSRIFAQRGVYEQVVETIARIGRQMKLGGPSDGPVDMGPLISRKQLDRVLGFLGEDRDRNLEVVTGGRRLDRPGYFVEPTVLTGVTIEMRVFREEIFGPVVTVMPFDDEEEAIALANGTVYGLAAAVWSGDTARGHRLAKHLVAGTVWINAQFSSDWSMPFSGHKQSGWGSEFGPEGLDAYFKNKAVYTAL